MATKLMLVSLFAAGCLDPELGNAVDREAWEGTVVRDDGEAVFTGYDPWRVDSLEEVSYQFAPQAVSILHTEEDGSVLAFVQISVFGWDRLQAEEGDEIPVVLASEIGQEDIGAALTWVEENDAGEQLFRHVYNEGPPEPHSEGTLAIVETDWTTYVVGELDADVGNGQWGVRSLEFTFRWGESDGE